MKPYTPNIDPHLAAQVMQLAANHMAQHGVAKTRKDAINHLFCAYTATLQRVLYDNMQDNFRSAVVVALENNTSMVSYADRHRQALRAALDGAKSYVSDVDDLSIKIQHCEAHEEEAATALLRSVATDIATTSTEKGLKVKGSAARFLSSQHITYDAFYRILVDVLAQNGQDGPDISGELDLEAPKPMKDNIVVTYTAQEKPFAEFAVALEKAAEAAGRSLLEVAALTKQAAASDETAIMTLLRGAGYSGTEQENASVIYAAGLIQAKRNEVASPIDTPKTETPATPVSSAESTPAPEPEPKPEVKADAPEEKVINISIADLSPEECVSLVRSVTGLTDEFIGSIIGVTRPTVKNIALGKSRTKVSDEGRKALANHLHGMIGDLTRVRDSLMLNL